MRKIAVICFVLIFSGGLAFSQSYFQLGVGFVYLSYPNTTGSAILACRANVTGDILFPVGSGCELGAELGVNLLPINVLLVDYMLMDIPVGILLRANLTRNRSVAFELHTGIRIRNHTVTGWDDSYTLSDSTFHVGGRFVLSSFYIGADYIPRSGLFQSAIVFEAGLKYTLGM